MSGHVSFQAWRAGDPAGGVHLGTAEGPDGVRLDRPVGDRRYADPYGAGGARSYAWSAWVTPAVTPGHRFTALVPSWNARTPGDSWLEVEARVSSDDVHWSRWFSLGRWAETDEEIHASSVPGQVSPEASVAIDVLAARGDVTWSSYQLRVTLHRGLGSTATPSLTLLGAVVTRAGEHTAPAAALPRSATSS